MSEKTKQLATEIVVAMINNDKNSRTDESKIEHVCSAYLAVYETIRTADKKEK